MGIFITWNVCFCPAAAGHTGEKNPVMKVYRRVFSPISVNTFVVAGLNGECIVIDCGCYDKNEFSQLVRFLEAKKLKTRNASEYAHVISTMFSVTGSCWNIITLGPIAVRMK
jgi:hypothetical protein